MILEVVKAHGTANDFVLIEDLDDALEIDAELVARLCDRRRGVGGDGIIRIAPGVETTVFMDYRNADGSIGEMCGNGIRCLAKYCFDRGILVGTEADIETRAGIKHVVVHADATGKVGHVEVDMGAPIMNAAEIPVKAADTTEGALARVDLTVDGTDYAPVAVSMGNPHAVLFVDDVTVAPVTTHGPQIATDPHFPEGTNVEFVRRIDDDRIQMRVWERGSGETQACGTGACAAAVAAVETAGVHRDVDCELPGGTLHISYGDTVVLRGPAVEVFSATVDTERL